VHYRYSIPSVRCEGWAEVVLGSDGFFAVVSDYGNWAFSWRHRGEGVGIREFILHVWPDYFINKIQHDDEFDAEGSVVNFKDDICRMRRERRLDAETARDLWDGLDYEEHNENALQSWYDDNSVHFSEGWENFRRRPCSQATAFAKNVLPRLKVGIALQLLGEALA
jgi:hypothetical protein